MPFQRNRFQKRELHVGSMLRPILTLAVFLLVFVLLLAGVRSVRKTTQQQELQNLLRRLRKCSVTFLPFQKASAKWQKVSLL